MRAFADQIRLADAGEIIGQACDAAFLGLAARDPENIVVAGQRPGCGVGIGSLGVIDETNRANLAHLFHAMRQAREAGDGIGDSPRVLDENPCRGICHGDILAVMRAG